MITRSAIGNLIRQVSSVRRPNSKKFTRGFLIVTPGITICDRLRVLQPNDPDSYFRSREIVPSDMLDDLDRAKIVITNYHWAFAEFCEVYQIEADFKAKVEAEFNNMIETVTASASATGGK